MAVFLPMLLMSSLHVHEATPMPDSACAECVHHQCAGHLIQLTTQLHQCVLCQFLTLSMVTAVMTVVFIHRTGRQLLFCKPNRFTRPAGGVVSLRAPPFF